MFLKTNKHFVAIFFISILFLSSIYIFQVINSYSVSTAAEISNWGLSFQKEGRPPVANATSDYLKKYNAYYVDKTDEKVIYMTFDAGFENGYTTNILDVLKKHDVKATFFLVGHYIKEEPELVRRMVNEGHIVGNHTYNHPDMSKISDIESFNKELSSLEELYKNVVGEDMKKYYRPPRGKFNEDNLKMANELGYKTIFWSLAYVDWYVDKQPSEKYAYSKLIPRIHPGAVVLLHNTSETNSKILDGLLTEWKKQGYSFKNIDKLIE